MLCSALLCRSLSRQHVTTSIYRLWQDQIGDKKNPAAHNETKVKIIYVSKKSEQNPDSFTRFYLLFGYAHCWVKVTYIQKLSHQWEWVMSINTSVFLKLYGFLMVFLCVFLWLKIGFAINNYLMVSIKLSKFRKNYFCTQKKIELFQTKQNIVNTVCKYCVHWTHSLSVYIYGEKETVLIDCIQTQFLLEFSNSI